MWWFKTSLLNENCLWGRCKKKLKKTNNSSFSATHTYIKLTLVSFFLLFSMHLPLITLNLIQCRLKWLLWVHFQLSITSGNINTFAHQPSTTSESCPNLVIKKIVWMLHSSFVWLIIFADGKISKYWFHKSLPRSIYSISILLLEFIFPFVRPSEYIIK